MTEKKSLEFADLGIEPTTILLNRMHDLNLLLLCEPIWYLHSHVQSLSIECLDCLWVSLFFNAVLLSTWSVAIWFQWLESLLIMHRLILINCSFLAFNYIYIKWHVYLFILLTLNRTQSGSRILFTTNSRSRTQSILNLALHIGWKPGHYTRHEVRLQSIVLVKEETVFCYRLFHWSKQRILATLSW